MKIAGVIAEYNPFHNGHEYHLTKTREAGATHIVAVMSGSVVQRGEVAVADAHFRAEAAIKHGADLVLELPPQFALGAARDFARAGVNIIRRLGCVDVLSFGAETADVGILKSALESLESAELRIKELMSNGRTYPQAAAEACGEEFAAIILGQNNTLALEYLRALKNSDITPVAVKRTVPHDSEVTTGGFASASQIRKLLKSGENARDFLACGIPADELSFTENGERAMLWRLSMMSKEDFGHTPYCAELAGRLYQSTRRAGSLEEVFSAVKSRNVTHARVRRAVMQAVLGVTIEDVKEPQFARVLALNARGAEILKACKKTASIPLGDSLSELARLSPEAKRQAELIELASRLQALCRKDGSGVSEYKRSARLIE